MLIDPRWCFFVFAPGPFFPLVVLVTGFYFQVQATVVGFLASIAAVIFGWIPDGHFSLDHAVLLCASSVATAFIASLVLGKRQIPYALHAPLPQMLSSPYHHPVFFLFFILGMIMIGVIIGSRKMGINPDNVATPIAASLGDLITLALLSGISWGLYKELGEEQQKAFVSPWSFHVLQHLPCNSPRSCSFTLTVLGVCRVPGLEAIPVSKT